MTPDLYIRRAEVLRWVDGDTVDLRVDQGRHMTLVDRHRLVGPDGRPFDAWEKRGDEREKGLSAWEFARDWAREGTTVYVRTFKDRRGSFGRWLAQLIHVETGDDLATHMVAAGHGEWGN